MHADKEFPFVYLPAAFRSNQFIHLVLFMCWPAISPWSNADMGIITLQSFSAQLRFQGSPQDLSSDVRVVYVIKTGLSPGTHFVFFC
ncbi:unnamed protein product [Spodoptera littoralis]|uniref:Uncharacterized protein n=1 Tax=Spodoptera littoralis TaxID=7109 RepID=A0A9P0IB81_SPOLI|nr:unnamed protein product [Spodoptera littoralis]CAH1644394.1 unnamed protein product [Spodoptera littoralis]